MDWEFAVLDFLQTIHTAFGDALLKIITHFGDAGLFWIALAAVLLISKKYRKAGAAMGLALIFGLIIANITLKPLVARVRPYDIKEGIDTLVKRPKDFSFPSGHTLSSFAASCALLKYHKKIGICAVVLASLIAFSRLYLYIHFPTDVIAGLLIGIGCAVLACLVIRKIEEKFPDKTSKIFGGSQK